MNESIHPRPLVVMLLGAGGAAVGTGIILYQYDANEASLKFASTPQFLVWLFFIGATAALLAIVAVPLWRSLRELGKYFASNRREIILSSLVLTLLCAVPSNIPSPELSPLAYHRIKIRVVVILGFLVALMAVVGIWLVRAGLRTLVHSAEPDEKRIADFIRLREQLQLFLSTWVR
jgi:hypothetical protein